MSMLQRTLGRVAAAAAVLGLALAAAPAVRAELPPLIPRDVLFGNPERVSPQLSPDGQRLAWIAPDKNNVLQVWVKTIGKDDDKVVTADKKRGIRSYFWAEDSRTLLYMQDADGDENFHVYGVDLGAGTRARPTRPSRACGPWSSTAARPSPTRCWWRSTRGTGDCSTCTA